MTVTKKRIFTAFAILSFVVSLLFLFSCIDMIARHVFEIVTMFKPMKPDRLFQLKGVLLGNSLLFFVFGLFFILVQHLHFEEDYCVPLRFLPSAPSISEKKQFLSWLKEKLCQRQIIALILIFIGISGIRFFWMNQKTAFHEDEVYGVSIATQNEYGLWSGKDFNQNQAYTGKEIKEAIFFDDASLKDTFRDLAHLWIYNRDTAYNNLYLYLNRIWFTGVKTDNFKAIFIRASLLNYVFFCFAFYFFCLLLAQITDNSLAKVLIPLAAFLNPASIGISVFMRSYALQETLLILFSYVFVFYYKNILSRQNVFSKSNFLKTSIVAMLIFSTDYFSILFIALAGLILIAMSLKKKNIRMVHFLFCAVFFGLLLTKCLYINYGTGFFSGRGAEAFSATADGSHTLQTILLLNKFVSANMLPLVVLLLVATVSCILSCRQKDTMFPLHTVLFFIAIGFIFAVLYVSPVIAFRYVASAFALLPIGLLFARKSTLWNTLFSCVQILLIVFVIANVMPLQANFSKIEHLNDSKEQYVSSRFFKDITTPVVIHSRADYPNILPYLHDNQIVYFAKSLEEAKSFAIKADAFWYVDVIRKNNELVLTEELITTGDPL